MKLNNTHNVKRNKGMTLLELTVVILVLLSLISILFVGARAWKKGSDRSANIMNIRNCQQAMRGHQNMRGLEAGEAFVQSDLEEYITMPSDIGPSATPVVAYTAGTTITAESGDPAVDTAHLWLVPNGAGSPTGEYGHDEFADITGW